MNVRCTPLSDRSTPARSEAGGFCRRVDQLVGVLVSLAPLADAAVDDLLQMIAAGQAAHVRRADPGAGIALRQHRQQLADLIDVVARLPLRRARAASRSAPSALHRVRRDPAPVALLPDDAEVETSKKVVSTLLTATDGKGYANFSRYPGTLPPGISRNAYGLLGSASVLIEMRGDIGQKSNGYIAKTAYVASASVVDALADGSLYSTSTGPAEALQQRGPLVDGPGRVVLPRAQEVERPLQGLGLLAPGRPVARRSAPSWSR